MATPPTGTGKGRGAGSRGTQFKAGAANPNAKVEGKAPPTRVEVGPLDPLQRLKDMRHVYANPASTDKTPGEKATRAWMLKSPAQFMSILHDLEEGQKEDETPKDIGEPVEEKETDQELRDQIEVLIRRHSQ